MREVQTVSDELMEKISAEDETVRVRNISELLRGDSLRYCRRLDVQEEADEI